ncbi:MAG: efflux RND transporter periplasmic adaptor subunit [Bacteroidetes bacterium]|nr:efflux RND transporter periplasmic adaptor subunit [Bacteroidota bacterium]
MSQKLTLTGEIIPLNRANIYAKTAGYIKDLKVDIGSKVTKGQILCVIEAPELNAAQAQARSTSMSAKAKYESSRSTYLRLVKAAQVPGAVAANELDVAHDQMSSDSAAYQAAREAEKANSAIAGYLTVRAPFNGVVTTRNIFKGDYVDNTGKMLLFTVDDNSLLRIDVDVPEAYNSALLDSNKATFTIAADPGVKYKAELARKSDAVDPQIRAETWEFTFRNQASTLKPGMLAQVTLPVSRRQPGFMVPYKAVLTTQERKVVMKVLENHVKWVDVKTGFTGSDKTEVLGELNTGDQLINAPNEEIRDGAYVKIANNKPSQ